GPPGGLSPWSEQKKNIFSLRLGPPGLPPYWFCLYGCTRVSKKLRASATSLRRNSNSVPCIWLVPERVVSLMDAPAPRLDASKLDERTENSWIVSGLGSVGAEPQFRLV